MTENVELRILSGITSYPNIALDFSYNYENKLFLDVENKLAAKPILDYIKAYKTKPTKRALLEYYSEDKLIQDSINNVWDKIDSIKYDEADYPFDIDQLKKLYSKHKYNELKLKANEQVDIKSLESIINEIKVLNKSNTFTQKTLKDHILDFAKEYTAKLNNPELARGILTGYSYLDYIKNGLIPADLIIIAGESGSGKSLFLNNMALNIWKQSNTIDTPASEFKKGYNVVYFSLEMPFKDCFQRTMAALADVPSYHIRDAKLTNAESIAVKKACKFIKNYPYNFDIIDVPRGLTAEELELHMERIKSKYNPDVIFIDYLGLMEEVSDEDDWLSLGRLAGKVHEFARVYNIPVVTAVQLNRMPPQAPGKSSKGEKSEEIKRIGLHRIGRSSLIATHATLILQIDQRPNEKDLADFKYHIIKNRHGENGGCGRTKKNFAHCSLIDIPFDTETADAYMESDDISVDVSSIFEEIQGF